MQYATKIVAGRSGLRGNHALVVISIVLVMMGLLP